MITIYCCYYYYYQSMVLMIFSDVIAKSKVLLEVPKMAIYGELIIWGLQEDPDSEGKENTKSGNGTHR